MRLITAILLLIVSIPANADLVLNYNGFYNRIKKLQQPQYSDLTLAFALVQVNSEQACQFYSLKLVSQEHDIDLNLTDDEISLPYDETLKNANTMLQVLQADNAAPCQLEMRLRSRMRLPATLNFKQLSHYRNQFDVLLDDMAGVSKYWLPEVTGVIAEFNSEPVLDDAGAEVIAATTCEGTRCQIRLASLSEDATWPFNQRPRFLLPLIEKSTP
ncbi:MAG TPA: DUF2987 domain-containing protein [Rheinheimera sp.]|nr:DUF2987 domain-containing protein [Rheinheimera sp.]